MSEIDIAFCRSLLVEAHKAVKVAFPDVKVRADAWVWHHLHDNWEFHGPDKFYWHGGAANAYDARYKGWMAWLKFKGVQHDDDE